MKHKRRKRSRLRGARTCGWGSRKKHRGKGHRGGVGMSGTGKRADQRKTWINKYIPDYFGKHGFKSRKLNIKTINIEDIEKHLDKLVKEGKAKKTTSGFEVNLKEFKILGKGNIKSKLTINAHSFSSGAKEKIEKAGGKANAGAIAQETKEKPEESKEAKESEE